VKDVTLAILAGGEGSRMGKPKGELMRNGVPVLSYLLLRAAWSDLTMLVTAPGREHPPGAEEFSSEVVDPVAGQGPLRGLLTALTALTTPTLLVGTVDMIDIGVTQYAWLIDRLKEHPQALGIFMRHGQQVEPFPSIYRKEAAEIVRAQFESGQLSVHKLAAHPNFLVLSAPAEWDALVWTNLNRPEDLAAYNRREVIIE